MTMTTNIENQSRGNLCFERTEEDMAGGILVSKKFNYSVSRYHRKSNPKQDAKLPMDASFYPKMCSRRHTG